MFINVFFFSSFSKNSRLQMLFWGYGDQELSSLSVVIHKFMSKKLRPFCLIMCTRWETWCLIAMRYVRIRAVRIIFTLVERRRTANFCWCVRMVKYDYCTQSQNWDRFFSTRFSQTHKFLVKLYIKHSFIQTTWLYVLLVQTKFKLSFATSHSGTSANLP